MNMCFQEYLFDFASVPLTGQCTWMIWSYLFSVAETLTLLIFEIQLGQADFEASPCYNCVHTCYMLCFSQSWTQSFALSFSGSKICDSTFLLQEGTSQKVVHSLWFRTTFTGHVFGHPVSPFALQRPVPVLSRLRHLHSVQLELAPGRSSCLALMDIVIDGGRLASLSFTG